MGKLLKWGIKTFYVLVFVTLACIVYYFYTPKSAVNLHERIATSNPNILNEERMELSKEVEKYLIFGLSKDQGKKHTLTRLRLFLANQRKFLDLSFNHAIDEITKTQVVPGNIRIWSFMNMGAVVKTNSKVLAFDTADMTESVVQKQLTNIVDIFFITHADTDHYDPSLLKKALQQGRVVVFPEDPTFIEEFKEFTNVYYLKDGESVDINGVKITAFQTDHRGDNNFAIPKVWYFLETDNLKLLHTGDGFNFKDTGKRKSLEKIGIDIFLCNAKIHPNDIRDINPRVVVPLHLFKFLAKREELNISTFDYVSDFYRQHEKTLRGIDVKLLFPGESFEYHTN